MRKNPRRLKSHPKVCFYSLLFFGGYSKRGSVIEDRKKKIAAFDDDEDEFSAFQAAGPAPSAPSAHKPAADLLSIVQQAYTQPPPASIPSMPKQPPLLSPTSAQNGSFMTSPQPNLAAPSMLTAMGPLVTSPTSSQKAATGTPQNNKKHDPFASLL